MSSLTDKLTLANDKVPNVYDAGKSCKDMTDWSYYFFCDARLDMLDCINTCCGTDFYSMFSMCSLLTTIPQLDTSNGTDFSNMFEECSSLTTIPQLDTSNGTNFSSMFMNCPKLTTIPQLDTSNGTDFSYMFYYCSSLTTIPQLDTSNGTDFLYMFDGCEQLQNIVFSGTINTSISFESSSKLTLESLLSIINALKVNTSATKPNLTLTNASWELLDASAPPTGLESWADYVTDVKGWTYAYVD